ncbi:hypothetical protein [Nocardioides stalactiti]|nr:hypothetical protein [Nocardioides stalactiti]
MPSPDAPSTAAPAPDAEGPRDLMADIGFRIRVTFPDLLVIEPDGS